MCSASSPPSRRGPDSSSGRRRPTSPAPAGGVRTQRSRPSYYGAAGDTAAQVGLARREPLAAARRLCGFGLSVESRSTPRALLRSARLPPLRGTRVVAALRSVDCRCCVGSWRRLEGSAGGALGRGELDGRVRAARSGKSEAGVREACGERAEGVVRSPGAVDDSPYSTRWNQKLLAPGLNSAKSKPCVQPLSSRSSSSAAVVSARGRAGHRKTAFVVEVSRTCLGSACAAVSLST